MTLNDLREQTKAAFAAFSTYRNVEMATRDSWNMREAWAYAQKYRLRFEDITDDRVIGFREEYHKVVMDLAKTGEIYYHAKKHGIQSAIMFRLQRI